MAKKNVLSVEGLTKRYGEKLLFKGLTFGLSAGQRVAIVAKNDHRYLEVEQIFLNKIISSDFD